MAANPRKDTIKGQVAIAKEIVKYGMEHGYPGGAIRWAVKAAWIETKLGAERNHPSSAEGLYGYMADTFKRSNPHGHRESDADQIAAIYNDIDRNTQRYGKLDETRRKEVSLDEYLYIKHKQGANWEKFTYDPGEEGYKDSGKYLWDRKDPPLPDEVERLLPPDTVVRASPGPCLGRRAEEPRPMRPVKHRRLAPRLPRSCPAPWRLHVPIILWLTPAPSPAPPLLPSQSADRLWPRIALCPAAIRSVPTPERPTRPPDTGPSIPASLQPSANRPPAAPTLLPSLPTAPVLPGPQTPCHRPFH